jgi:hypothetical protein
MPVSTKHEQYHKAEERWTRCRDCYEGSDAVKAAGIKYLPELDSHKITGGGKAYEAYKQRALFFNAMGRTVDGFAGAVFQKSPTIKLDPEQENVLEPEMEPELDENLMPKLDEEGKPLERPKVGPDGQPVMKPKIGPDGKPIKRPLAASPFGAAEPAEQAPPAEPKDKLDENGKPIQKLDENGKPIPKLDENGDPVLDENGDPVFETEKEEAPPAEGDQEPEIDPATGKPKIGPDGKPVMKAKTPKLGPDGKPLPEEQAQEPEIDPATGKPKIGPDGKPVMKVKKEVLGPDGKPIPPKLGPDGKPLPEEQDQEPEIDPSTGKPKIGPDGKPVMKAKSPFPPKKEVLGPDGKPILSEEPEIDEKTGKPKLGPDGKPIMKQLGEPHTDEFGKPIVGPDGQPLRKPLAPPPAPVNPIKKHIQDITLTGTSLDLFAFEALQEVLTTGRYGILVDMADTENRDKQRPYWAGYEAESIINWCTDRVDGEEILTRVILREETEIPDPLDSFANIKDERYRVLKVEEGIYTQEVWAKGRALRDAQAALTMNDDGTSSRVSTLADGAATAGKKAAFNPNPYSIAAQRAMYNGEPTARPTPPPDFGGKQGDDWGIIETLTPVRRGKSLDFIPFYFINSTGAQPVVSKPPLLDLVDLNLSHYRTLADLEHGRHFVALPTPWISGAALNESNEVQIGPSGVLVLDKGGAAGMLEFSGAGLRALETADEQKRKMMAVLGARLLEEQALAAETATAVGMRHSGEQAVLRTIAQVLEQQLTKALRCHVWWMGTEKSPSDLDFVVVELSKDFYAMKMQPAELAQLLAALQADGISYKTFYYNLAVGGITRPGIDVEEEQRDISNKAEGGPGKPKMPNTPGMFAGTPLPQPNPMPNPMANPQFGLPNNGAPQKPAPPKGVTPPGLAASAAASKAAAAKAKGGSPFGRIR